MLAERRPTRDESKAQTRARLIEAAGEVFARDGFHAASLDQVAEAAGFSKGAVYSNFASKDELFLALLEQHLDERVQAVTDAVRETAGPAEARVAAAARQVLAGLHAEREWSLLLIEFWSYSLRDPERRQRFAERFGALRTAIAELIDDASRELGVESELSPDDLATAAIAMAHGIATEQLTDPGAVPDHLFGFMLASLFREGEPTIPQT